MNEYTQNHPDMWAGVPPFEDRADRKRAFLERWARITDALPSSYGVLTDNYFRQQGVALDLVTVRASRLNGYEGSTPANRNGNWPVLFYWETLADPKRLNTTKKVQQIIDATRARRAGNKSAAPRASV